MNQSIRLEPGTVFAKTPTGREEIQTRQLKLPPLVRRLLVLVDGKRNLQELSGFVPGDDAVTWLDSLVTLGCIEPVAADSAGGMTPSGVVVDVEIDVATPGDKHAHAPTHAPIHTSEGLPPPLSRSAQDTEMARHFMINTINRMLEQNSRLTLVESIFNSPDAAALRQHLGAWEAAIASSWMGARRLPELRKKLFAVL